VTICDQDYSTDIIERRWLSKKTFEIKLSRPASFTFKPGQRISLKHKKMERDYSLASSPDESHLKLCIRHVKKGVLSQELGDTQIGTRMSFAGPHGYFTFKDLQRPTVFIATGTGIAPFRSMVRSGISPDFLLHGVETTDDLYYSEEFQSAAESLITCRCICHRIAVISTCAGEGKWSAMLHCWSMSCLRALLFIPKPFIDGLVKSRKSKLFTSVFCIWYLVFSILAYRYCIIYFIPNTKHLMDSTFYESIFINHSTNYSALKNSDIRSR
jgi:hypothetical protein